MKSTLIDNLLKAVKEWYNQLIIRLKLKPAPKPVNRSGQRTAHLTDAELNQRAQYISHLMTDPRCLNLPEPSLAKIREIMVELKDACARLEAEQNSPDRRLKFELRKAAAYKLGQFSQLIKQVSHGLKNDNSAMGSLGYKVKTHSTGRRVKN